MFLEGLDFCEFCLFKAQSKFSIDLLRIMTRLQFELVPRVCAVEQLLELDVSILGFPLPFFGGLGVLRCRDDVPLGVLQVRSAAASGAGSEGTGSSTWYCLAI